MRFLQKFAALIITLIVVGVAFFYYLSGLATQSIIDSEESIESPLVNRDIKVYKNSFGIPHIIAENEYDAFLAIGYCHAEDRLWQMDLQRRIASGRLSEILGERTVLMDKFIRAFDIRGMADRIINSTDRQTLKLLQAYSDGINLFIEENYHYMPFEFNALNYVPEKWSPVDCILIYRLLALEFSMGFNTDIIMGEIAEKIGYSKALELVPQYPDDAPCICDEKREVDEKRKKSFFYQFFTDKDRRFDYKGREERQMLLCAYSKLWEETNRILNFRISMAGSNAWAVVKPLQDTINRYAVMANDPHLMLGIPAKWYQYHVSCPEFNVIGMSIPGAPFVLAGRNDYVSWGITNMMADDLDYFFEKTDKDNPDFYVNYIDGNYKQFNLIRDTIHIKGKEDYEYYMRSNDKSFVVSDAHMAFNKDIVSAIAVDSAELSRFSQKYCLTFSWTGQKNSYEMKALYDMMCSVRKEDFTDALKQWGVPALNFVYADNIGNIGVVPSGMLPARKNTNPIFPNPGWIKDNLWEGISDSVAFPQTHNPEKNYVISANNKISRDDDLFISQYWDIPARAERINEMLIEYTDYLMGFSARDAQIMQMDILSPYARDMLNIVLPILDASSMDFSETEKNVLVKLKEWDYIMAKNQPSSAIFNIFNVRLLYNTYYDELGEKLYRRYLMMPNFALARLYDMIENYNIHWFDDINTSQYEERNEIIIKSFREAVRKAAELFESDDIEEWQWGRIHQLKLKHYLSTDDYLRAALETESYEINGNYTTINCAAYDLFEPYEVNTGSSMRIVCDMQDSVVYTNIPGGASGQVLSNNYKDQVQLWLNGGYVKIPVAKTPAKGFKLMMEFYHAEE